MENRECKFGANCFHPKCTFSHPSNRKKPCNFGINCNNPKCTFAHPPNKKVPKNDMDPKNKKEKPKKSKEEKSQQICKKGAECKKFECFKIHPLGRLEKCQDGLGCKNSECKKLHPKKQNQKDKNQEKLLIAKKEEEFKGNDNKDISTQEFCSHLCEDYFCAKEHPPARKLLCKNKVNCMRKNCPFLHPPSVLCEQGDVCTNYDCPNKHPSTRPTICGRGLLCAKIDCIKLHPLERPTPCKDGKKCILFECELLHPLGRPHKCNETCSVASCGKLHPPTRKQRCGEWDKCVNFSCDLLHPKERTKKCKFGMNCHKSDCQKLHPPKPEPCPQGMLCNVFECKLLHPIERTKLCSYKCFNQNCEFIHPIDWNPLKSLEEKNCLLRKKEERELIRSTNCLPIFQYRELIIKNLKTDKFLFLQSDSGIGKSSQIPQYCAEEFPGLILSVQPRSISAANLAQRIANEFDNAGVGENVGYKIPGAKAIKGRKIQIISDLNFIQMVEKDPLLKDVSVLIIDEIQERSCNIDLAIGLAKLILQKRTDNFYTLLMGVKLQQKLNDLAIYSMNIPTYLYNILEETQPIEYAESYDFIIPIIFEKLDKYSQGDCLVFLPDAKEIFSVSKKFQKQSNSKGNLMVLTLFDDSFLEELQQIFSSDQRDKSVRRIIFCNDIAENCLTIPNISLVIDTGFIKEKHYDANKKINVVEYRQISKSSMEFRKNIAKKNSLGGIYISLFDIKKTIQIDYSPEIMRMSLDKVILQLKILGQNPLDFPFLNRPDPKIMQSFIELLGEMGCLDNTPSQNITEKGKLFGKLPFGAQMNNFLMTGHEFFDQSENFAIIASLLTAQSSIYSFGERFSQQKKSLKGKLMEKAFEYDSDIELLWQTFIDWYNSGKSSNKSSCDKCQKPVNFKAIIVGCRTCRMKFCHENQINKKTMEMVFHTKEKVLKLIKNYPKQALENKALSFSEIIGRCLASSFKEQIGELILPGNPAAGVHLIYNNTKGIFSETSTFLQKIQKNVHTVVCMSIQQSKNELVILDLVHPIDSSWIPAKFLMQHQSSRKEINEVFSFKNLSVRFASNLIRELNSIKNKAWKTYTNINYDNIQNHLHVYGPKNDNLEISKFANEIISKQLEEEQQYDVKIPLSQGSILGFFTAGMKLERFESSSVNKIRFVAPREIQTKEEFLGWLFEKMENKISQNDLKYVDFYKKNDNFKGIAVVTFKNEQTALEVQKFSQNEATVFMDHIDELSRTVCVKFTNIHKNANISKDLKEFLEKLPNPPVKIQEKGNSEANKIFLFEVPYQNVNEFKAFLTSLSLKNVINSHLPKTKKGKNFGIIKFRDKASADEAYNTLRNNFPVSSVKFGEDTAKSNEFFLTFSKTEDAEGFYKTKPIPNHYNATYEGHASIKVDKPHLFPIQQYLSALTSTYPCRYEFKQSNKQQNITKVVFKGESPRNIGKIAKEFIKALAPMHVKLNSRKTQKLIEEINDQGLFDKWDQVYGLEHKISEDKKTKTPFKLEIFGDKVNQAFFMNEILKYSDDFNQRYATVNLPNNLNFLFKKDRIGHNFIKKLSYVLKKQGNISYIPHENQIEVYFRPKFQNSLKDYVQKVHEFLKNHSSNDIEEELQANSQSCVFCLKEETHSFSICGHFFCPSCLGDRTKKDCSDGALVKCPLCMTIVSMRDIKSSLTEEELNSCAHLTLQLFFKNNKDSPYIFCPSEDCNGLREKKLGYSLCACCGVYSCPLCGEIDNDLHKLKSCAELQHIKKTNDFDLTWLFKAAEEFVHKNWDYLHLQNYIRVTPNPLLSLGCPAMQKFCRMLQQLGGLSKLKEGFFAWHGTPSEAGVIGICLDGFDPKRRSGQAYGVGEYFGQTSIVSHSYSQSSGRMIVSYLLKVPQTSTHGNFCYVVNNPLDFYTAYNLPVSVITYQNDNGSVNFPNINPVPLCFALEKTENYQMKNDAILSQNIVSDWKQAFRWFWTTDSGSFQPYTDTINAMIETNFSFYQNGNGPQTFTTPPIIRFIDDLPQNYNINFKENKQINQKTGYTRKIKREKVELPTLKVKWEYLDEFNKWQAFDTLALNSLETAFRNYYDRQGPSRLKGFNFPGRPESYTLDFVEGTQQNEQTNTVRKIRRNL